VAIKTVYVDGFMHSPTIKVLPGEMLSWKTELSILGQGELEIAVVVQELSRGKGADCRRWISSPARVSCGPRNHAAVI
jgi:hypothetical protein